MVASETKIKINQGLLLRGSQVLLEDVSLDWRGPKWISVLGPSGCGKSSLLKSIAGLIPWSQGQLEIYPTIPTWGYVFQEPRLFPWLNVLDNITLPSRIAKTKDAPELKSIQWLNKLGLSGAKSLRPHELSGGMQMRVSLARALVSDPDFLFLDEAFSSLDETLRENLQLELLHLQLQQPRTILLVTHSLSEALFVSDEVWIFDQQRRTLIQGPSLTPSPVPRSLSQKSSAEYLQKLDELRRTFSNLSQRSP